MKTKLLWVVIIVLVIIIAVMSAVILGGKDTEPDDTQGIVYEPNGSTVEQVQVGASSPNISIPGWSAIKLPAGKTNAEVSLHNPEENLGYYDLKFSLILKDTEEVIFETGLVQPGNQCNRVELLRQLEPGQYDAILCVQPYTQDTKTPTNNAELAIKLIVE